MKLQRVVLHLAAVWNVNIVGLLLLADLFGVQVFWCTQTVMGGTAPKLEGKDPMVDPVQVP